MNLFFFTCPFFEEHLCQDVSEQEHLLRHPSSWPSSWSCCFQLLQHKGEHKVKETRKPIVAQSQYLGNALRRKMYIYVYQYQNPLSGCLLFMTNLFVFIGPRCPWGPIYGSGPMSVTPTPFADLTDVTLA